MAAGAPPPPPQADKNRKLEMISASLKTSVNFKLFSYKMHIK